MSNHQEVPIPFKGMSRDKATVPSAIVMNMFYTGLGIARSLGERGIPVIGLTAHRGIYGNFTRYAQLRISPDSREEPEALLEFFRKLGAELHGPAVIFPTRDDDVLFLDRHREELGARFKLVLPQRPALRACLDKWETYVAATSAGVPSPRSWNITDREAILRILPDVAFPCVLKPVSAHHWRKRGNWERVGNRKAIGIFSADELLAEYDNIARAENRALLQELVPGGDECLWIAACYVDHSSRFIAGFATQKVVQVPEGFGTGCIVQTVQCPELVKRAASLLESIRFTGVAEVEFKRDPSGEFKLIEINSRPWDQHRLGKACGVDLIHMAYCDFAGLPLPAVQPQKTGQKWIADDVFVLLLLRSLWKRDGKFRRFCRLASGQRVYAIWSAKDPLPSFGFMVMKFVPGLLGIVPRYVRSLLGTASAGKDRTTKRVSV